MNALKTRGRKFALAWAVRAGIRVAALAALLGGGLVRAAGLAPADDQSATLQNQAITISVLANDSDVNTNSTTNQLAILQVTAPAHGTVVVNSNTVPLNTELAGLFSFAAIQLSNTVKQVVKTNLYPRATLNNSGGVWNLSQSNDWITGFFPGAMWYIYEQTGDTNFSNWARQWTFEISTQQHVTNTDDVGFEINTSFGNGYRLTGDTNYRSVLMTTAQSLTNRFSAIVGCIADDTGPTSSQFQVILDTMMNSELLYHATDLGATNSMAAMSHSHMRKAMVNQIRPDNSTYHMVIYDPTNGALIFQGTRAGYSNTSTWARGHSWSIYAFTMGYRETGDTDLLGSAERVANYYLTNVPSDYVPYWDYDAPDIPNALRDSSAAAIALSGMVQLSLLETNYSNSAKYWLGARHILSSLASTNYLAQGVKTNAILLHGTGEPPQLSSTETNVSLIYGDYYFVESLRRLADAYRRTSVTYVPNTNFAGFDSFTYQVCDSAGNCSNATVTVFVQATNGSPPAVTAQIARAPVTHCPTISFTSAAGRLYEVDYKDSLDGSWNMLTNGLQGSGATISVTDPSPQAPQRYYRVGGH